MTTPPQARPRVKPAGHISLRRKPSEDAPGLVTIARGKVTADYALTPIPSDFGTAFRLEKLGTDEGEVYHVNLDGIRTTCDCKGHLRHGHCKHADGLSALVAGERL